MRAKIIIIFLCSCFLASGSENKYSGNEFVFAIPKNVYFYQDLLNKEIKLNILSQNSDNEIVVTIGNQELDKFQLDRNENKTIDLIEYESVELFTPGLNKQNYILIRSTKPIVVNFISSTVNSSDATVLLPNKQLGTDYTLISWNNSIVNDNPMDTLNYLSFSYVIAIENETIIKIDSDNIFYTGNENTTETEIVLNKNEIFYFTAGLENSLDLTGTSISSNKKIAVYTGHRAAKVLNLDNSRDLLLTQLEPNYSYGTEYIVGRFHREEPEFLPIYRVISLYDDNIIEIDNSQYQLDKNDWQQFLLKRNTHIKSTKPIIVAEYMKTLPIVTLGDPSLLTLTSTEQYVDFYAYSVPKVEEVIKHYVGISCHDSVVSTITLNGVNLVAEQFEKVENTEFNYGVFPIYSDNVVLSSNYDFGAIAFGVGSINSYAMNLGSNMKNMNEYLDNSPAKVLTDLCANIITISDSSEFQSGIDSVYFESKNLDNINVSENDSYSTISYELIDDRKDAEIILSVRDGNNNRIDTTIIIKGFTIDAELEIQKEQFINNSKEWTLYLTNTGTEIQKLKLQMTNGNLINVPPSVRNLEIESGDRETKPIFSYSDMAKEYSDTLIISNECDRQIAIPIDVNFTFYFDAITSCESNFEFYDTDKYRRMITGTDVYSADGKLLESRDKYIERENLKKKYRNKPIIIKEYHNDHFHLHKYLFQ